MKMKDYYLDLVEEIENLKADIKHLKNIALRISETSSIWRYHEKLLESGLTMEELEDYIKELREFYEIKEKENDK